MTTPEFGNRLIFAQWNGSIDPDIWETLGANGARRNSVPGAAPVAETHHSGAWCWFFFFLSFFLQQICFKLSGSVSPSIRWESSGPLSVRLLHSSLSFRSRLFIIYYLQSLSCFMAARNPDSSAKKISHGSVKNWWACLFFFFIKSVKIIFKKKNHTISLFLCCWMPQCKLRH